MQHQDSETEQKNDKKVHKKNQRETQNTVKRPPPYQVLEKKVSDNEE
jgi:hypothetical protein